MAMNWKSTLAAVVLGAASSAHAAIVDTWNYSVSSEWLSVTGGQNVVLTPLSLSWGNTVESGGVRSSLVISNSPSVGSLDTYIGGGAPPVVAPFLGTGNTLTHNNFSIPSGSGITGAVLRSTLTLDDPTVAGTQPGALPSLTFDIAFTETPNVSGSCVAPSPPNNPCNDIFVLKIGLLNAVLPYPDASQLYFINIFPIAGGALGLLDNAICAAAGVITTTGCLGFTTIEGQSNPLSFGFTISTERLDIPEPGTLALAGLALLGAGMARRRMTARA